MVAYLWHVIANFKTYLDILMFSGIFVLKVSYFLKNVSQTFSRNSLTNNLNKSIAGRMQYTLVFCKQFWYLYMAGILHIFLSEQRMNAAYPAVLSFYIIRPVLKER